jgi:uncharacterized OB-fold protein
MTDDNWDDETWYDDEDDEPGEEHAAACRECGGLVYDFTDKCPACGHWLSAADRRAMRPGESRLQWQKATAAIIILALLACLLIAGWTIF